ncbi:MAG TPA: secretin N-terminal domain-containing protein [Luteitalea sp.]|nr:secretin N-terminal domain-containing protein [Luteitalea sp.]
MQIFRWATTTALVAVLCAMAMGCATSGAFRRGQQAGTMGDWDAAVAAYRQALQENPDRPEYKIALERASLSASLFHLERARKADEQGDLETAVQAYRKVYEYDPANRTSMLRAAEIDKELRERAEAARPRPAIEAMRETARQRTAPPLLNPASRDPLEMRFPDTSAKDALTFLGKATGINVQFESTFRDAKISVDLTGLSLEEGLTQVMTAAGLFYKVMNPRTILVIPDTPPKRAAYEEQVIRTFYLSHADSAELVQTVQQILQLPGLPVQPRVLANKTQNSLTVRASDRVMNIIDQVIRNNDKPRAELVVDLQVIEVNRARAKQIGLNLSQYSVGSIFSPEAPPGSGEGGTTTAPFNLNTITRGISTADFYLTVPQAVVNFLASDGSNKIIAKPQLRFMEGKVSTLDLGDEIPVPSTTFGGIGGGGLTTIPINQFNYRTVGIKLKFNNPRVTLEGEIVTELEVESSTLGASIDIAGQSLPTFGTRRAASFIRMREGESLMLAGLLREDQRRSLTGFPGLLRTPLLGRLFGSTNDTISQTDIVFLMTPRLVRTSEITQENLDPIYIGSQQNLGLTGAPPLIATDPNAAPAAAAPGTAPPVDPAAVIPVPGAPQPVATMPVQPPSTGAVTTQPSVLPPANAPPVPVPATPPPPGEAPNDQAAAQAAQQGQQAGPAAAARLSVTSPGPQFAVGGGPYTVPITVNDAQRMSTLSVSVTYNPSVLRVRAVQPGTFLAQGGVTPTFTQQIDPGAGRVDITMLRPGDQVGATGTGLVATLVFEAIATGQSAITPAGVAANPEQGAINLQLQPANVTVR